MALPQMLVIPLLFSPRHLRGTPGEAVARVTW
jgi:hypothetical protein